MSRSSVPKGASDQKWHGNQGRPCEIPMPGDGKNDGIFFLPLKDFMKLYSNVMTVR